jgi:hypothetical protein
MELRATQRSRSMRTAFVGFLLSTIALGQQAGSGGSALEIRQAATRDLERLEAQITALKENEDRSQRKLAELLKTYQESHPNVVTLKKKLDMLRAQQEALSQVLPHVEALKSLKQANARLRASSLPDRWWKNLATAQSLGLTSSQVKQMDEVFQQFRLKLIDLTAALEREEVILEPLVSAEPLEEARITAQIDRIAQARAELEKANGRMLLGIRKLLTPEQWGKVSQ